MFFQTLAASVSLLAISFLLFFSLIPGLLKRIINDAKYPFILWGFLLLGLILRLAWILYTQPEPFSDFLYYWQGAQQLAQGDFSPQGLIHTPGGSIFYSFVIALLGPHLWAVWGTNLFFSALLMLGMYLLGKQVGGERTGLFSLALTALLPQLITYSALVNTEIPALTFFTLILWQVMEAVRVGVQKQIAFGLRIGILLYGCILLRPTFGLLMLTLPIVLWIYRKQVRLSVIKFSASVIITVLLLGSSWAYYQYSLTGVPRLSWCSVIWLGAATSYNEINGTPNPKTYIHLYPGIQQDLGSPDYHQRAKALLAMETHFKKRALSDPIRYLQHGLLRMKASLWSASTGILWSMQNVTTRDSRVKHLFTEISTQIWRVLLILAASAMLFVSKKWRSPLLQGHSLLFINCWLVLHYLFSAPSERYGVQIIPFLIFYLASLFNLIPSETTLQVKPARTALLESKAGTSC